MNKGPGRSQLVTPGKLLTRRRNANSCIFGHTQPSNHLVCP